MESLMACVVGLLFAAALYMMLRRSIVKLVIGLMLLTNTANLLLFTVAGLSRGMPPLLPPGGQLPPGAELADPLPQALILTAIVISFAVLAFAVVLIQRAHEVVGSDDLDQMSTTDT